MKLRYFLPLLFLLFFIITTSIAFFTIRYNALNQVEAEQIAQMRFNLSQLQMNVARFLALEDRVGVTNIVSSLKQQPQTKVVALIDAEGQILASTDAGAVGQSWADLVYLPNRDVVETLQQTKMNQVVKLNSPNLLEGYSPICNTSTGTRPNGSGCGFLFYVLDGQYAQDQATMALLDLIKLVAIGFLLSTLVFSMVVYARVTRRIGQFMRGLKAFLAGDFRARTHLWGDDELSEMGRTLNHLLNTFVKERQDLVASEQTLSAIIDSTKYSLISTTPEGIIMTFNKSAERILGYRADEMIGKLTPMVFHRFDEVEAQAKRLSEEYGVDIQPGIDVFTWLPRQGRAFDQEWTYVCKDGTEVPVVLSITAIYNEQGEVTAYVGISHDVSEQKKVDNIKNEFVSTVSHELRTPLTSIKGSLALVKSGILGELPAKMQGMLEIAYNNSERLVLLINDILDIDKIASGKMQYQKAPCELVNLVNQSLTAMQPYARDYHIALRFETAVDRAVVFADANRMLQVMENLLSNAIKFSPSNGTVGVVLQADNEQDVCDYRICVKDQGDGIPEAFQAKIYERFTQADSSNTRQKGGTGLGLSITKSIVEHHEGELSFVTGKTGTTFCVRLARYNG